MGSPEDCVARYRALRVEASGCFRPIAILTYVYCIWHLTTPPQPKYPPGLEPTLV